MGQITRPQSNSRDDLQEQFPTAIFPIVLLFGKLDAEIWQQSFKCIGENENRLLFLINLLLVGTIFHLTAQENEMINFNRAFINQIGYYNIIKSIQHQEGTSGNLIDASQQIENQSAYIEQLGTD